jgi:hypothetical protein
MNVAFYRIDLLGRTPRSLKITVARVWDWGERRGVCGLGGLRHGAGAETARV